MKNKNLFFFSRSTLFSKKRDFFTKKSLFLMGVPAQIKGENAIIRPPKSNLGGYNGESIKNSSFDKRRIVICHSQMQPFVGFHFNSFYHSKIQKMGISNVPLIRKGVKGSISTHAFKRIQTHLNETKREESLKSYYWNQCFDKGRLKNFVLWFFLNNGEHKTIQLVEQFKNLGFEYATKAGISLGIEDLKIPPKKSSLIFLAEKETSSTIKQYKRGDITGVERFQRLIDTWHRTSEQLKQEVIDHFESTDILNPVYMMAFSGARGNISQVRQLVGMRGLMSNPQGQIIDFPIRSNFREGLTLTEYIISSYGARKGIVDTALRTANAGYLTRRLVDVAQHVIISNFDCGTHRGIFLKDMKEGNKTIVSLSTRLVGRVCAADISVDNEKIARRNDEISIDLAYEISKVTKKVFIRSALTCETKKLVCQLCYGWSLAQGNLVSIGEAIGVISAQSIGEPGTQLTMRTFHTGGVFSGDVSDQIRMPYQGIILYNTPIPGTLIRTPEGKIAFLTKAEGSFTISKISIFSDLNLDALKHEEGVALTPYNLKLPTKKETKKYKIPAYTLLFARNGEIYKEKEVIAQISSISRQKNATDDAELTIKSEIEGQLYINYLEVKENKVGPKLTKKEKENESESELTFHPQNFFSLFKNDKEQMKNALVKDSIFEAWSWGNAWILSGKIYHSPKPSSFFSQKGDYINQQSLMNGPNGLIYTSNVSGLVKLDMPTRSPSKSSVPFDLRNPNLNSFVGLTEEKQKEKKNSTNFPISKNEFLSFSLKKILYHKVGYFIKLNSKSTHLGVAKMRNRVEEQKRNSSLLFLKERYQKSTTAFSGFLSEKDSLFIIPPNHSLLLKKSFIDLYPSNWQPDFNFVLQWFPSFSQTKTPGILTFEEISGDTCHLSSKKRFQQSISSLEKRFSLLSNKVIISQKQKVKLQKPSLEVRIGGLPILFANSLSLNGAEAQKTKPKTLKRKSLNLGRTTSLSSQDLPMVSQKLLCLQKDNFVIFGKSNLYNIKNIKLVNTKDNLLLEEKDPNISLFSTRLNKEEKQMNFSRLLWIPKSVNSSLNKLEGSSDLGAYDPIQFELLVASLEKRKYSLSIEKKVPVRRLLLFKKSKQQGVKSLKGFCYFFAIALKQREQNQKLISLKKDVNETKTPGKSNKQEKRRDGWIYWMPNHQMRIDDLLFYSSKKKKYFYPGQAINSELTFDGYITHVSPILLSLSLTPPKILQIEGKTLNFEKSIENQKCRYKKPLQNLLKNNIGLQIQKVEEYPINSLNRQDLLNLKTEIYEISNSSQNPLNGLTKLINFSSLRKIKKETKRKRSPILLKKEEKSSKNNIIPYSVNNRLSTRSLISHKNGFQFENKEDLFNQGSKDHKIKGLIGHNSIFNFGKSVQKNSTKQSLILRNQFPFRMEFSPPIIQKRTNLRTSKKALNKALNLFKKKKRFKKDNSHHSVHNRILKGKTKKMKVLIPNLNISLHLFLKKKMIFNQPFLSSKLVKTIKSSFLNKQQTNKQILSKYPNIDIDLIPNFSFLEKFSSSQKTSLFLDSPIIRTPQNFLKSSGENEKSLQANKLSEPRLSTQKKNLFVLNSTSISKAPNLFPFYIAFNKGENDSLGTKYNTPLEKSKFNLEQGGFKIKSERKETLNLMKRHRHFDYPFQKYQFDFSSSLLKYQRKQKRTSFLKSNFTKKEDFSFFFEAKKNLKVNSLKKYWPLQNPLKSSTYSHFLKEELAYLSPNSTTYHLNDFFTLPCFRSSLTHSLEPIFSTQKNSLSQKSLDKWNSIPNNVKFYVNEENFISPLVTFAKTFSYSPFEGEILNITSPFSFFQKSQNSSNELPFIQKEQHTSIILTKSDLVSFYLPSYKEGLKEEDQKTTNKQLVKKKSYIIKDILVPFKSNALSSGELSEKEKEKPIHVYKIPQFSGGFPTQKVRNSSIKTQKSSKYAVFNKYKDRNLLLGDFIVSGDALGEGVPHIDSKLSAATSSGQIIHISKEKVTIRKGQPLFISPKAILHKFNGDFIERNSPVITLSYQQLKTGDIVQGIPKIEQFFEARTTKRGRLFRDSLPNLLKALFRRYIQKLPLEKAVRQSFYKIQQIIVDGVLRVYRSQGVTIADKHLEIIVKQMTSKVRILEGGQTGFFPGEVVDLEFVERVNKLLMKKIQYEPLVLGITKSSLEVESFLSAASFQQTTRVLSQAAISRKKDFLKGLKENVILGNLIPAGTGYLVYLDDFYKDKRNANFIL